MLRLSTGLSSDVRNLKKNFEKFNFGKKLEEVEHLVKVLKDLNKLLSTEDKGKKAFAEFLKHRITLKYEDQENICRKIFRLESIFGENSTEKIADYLALLFFSLKKLSEEKIIPLMNDENYESWEKVNSIFYSNCFNQYKYNDIDGDDITPSTTGSKENLAGFFYILKKVYEDKANLSEETKSPCIVDSAWYKKYRSLLKEGIEKPVRGKEMFIFLLCLKRNKVNRQTFPKVIAQLVFNEYLNK